MYVLITLFFNFVFWPKIRKLQKFAFGFVFKSLILSILTYNRKPNNLLVQNKMKVYCPEITSENIPKVRIVPGIWKTFIGHKLHHYMTVEQILIVLWRKLIFEVNVFKSFIYFISNTQTHFSNMYCQNFRCLNCEKILIFVWKKGN